MARQSKNQQGSATSSPQKATRSTGASRSRATAETLPKVRPEKTPEGLWVIKPVGRGSVPKQLRGLYTSYSEAEKQIKMAGR